MKLANKGFSFIELLITLGIIAMLGAIAWPAYKNYRARLYYDDILETAKTYQDSVSDCFKIRNNLNDCDAGRFTIPKDLIFPPGPIEKLTVENGVITIVPDATKQIKESDTYVLIPQIKNNKLFWQTSGGECDIGVC